MEDRQIVSLGFVLCLLGIVLALLGGGGPTGLPTLATTFVLLLVSGAGVVLAVSYAADWEQNSVQLPEPERRPQYHRQGDSITDRFDAISLAGHAATREDVDERIVLDGTDESQLPREILRDELHELTVEVLTRTTGCRRDEALQQVADGSWTDDTEAAAFFTTEQTPQLSWRHRIPGVPAPELPTVRRAKRVIAVLNERLFDTEIEKTSPTPRSPPRAYWPTASLPVTNSVGLTRQLAIAILAVSSVGVLTSSSGLVLVSTLGVAVAATAKFSEPTVLLTLDRELDDRKPAPGEEVTVTVRVRNDGDRTLPDLRILDGVPAGLSVVEDSPRFGTSLRPGKAAEFSYTVEAVPGTHTFEPTVAVASDYIGAVERIEPIESRGKVTCGFERESRSVEPPQPHQPRQQGAIESEATGSGVEFDTVRSYRPGDPPSRIDWRRRAKTGELSTIDFVEPRRPRIVLVVDDRAPSYVAAGENAVPAPRQAAEGAHELAGRLLGETLPVGLWTISEKTWLPPAVGEDQRAQIREVLAGRDAVGWTPATDSKTASENTAALTARLDPDTQVIVLSPLADDDSVALCRRLDAAGHAVSVIALECTDEESFAGAYGRLERWSRCSQLRSTGVTVRDWDPETPIVEVRGRD